MKSNVCLLTPNDAFHEPRLPKKLLTLKTRRRQHVNYKIVYRKMAIGANYI